MRYFKNQTLPDVNVQAGYGLTGAGRHALRFSDTVPAGADLVVTSPYSDVLREW